MKTTHLAARGLPAMIPTDTLFAVDESYAMRLIAGVDSRTIEAALALPLGTDSASPIEMFGGGVGVLSIHGILTKRASIFQQLFGGASTLAITAAAKAATDDAAIEALVLDVDSPGGSVDGLAEAGDALFALAQVKPVFAQVSGLCASAGYYLASQATAGIFAGRMDLVGSIGTRILMFDFSKMFENEGIKAVTIDSGVHKSAGVMGTKITDEQIAHFQSIVDGMAADFVAAVARGRSMSTEAVQESADGRVFLAADAVERGLIDGIKTLDETIALAGATQTQPSRTGDVSAQHEEVDVMSDQPTNKAAGETPPAEPATPKPATLAELKAGIPNASDAFIVKALEEGLTLDAAKSRALSEMSAAAEAKDAENAKLRAELADAKKPGDGVDAIGDAGDAGEAAGDAEENYHAEITQVAKSRGITRPEATRIVNKKSPELRDAFELAAN